MKQLRRREFFHAFVAPALLLPTGARAGKVPLVGVLAVGAPGSEQFWQQFRAAMRDLGYVEGRTVRYEFRTDGGEASRLTEIAAELVQLKPDVIVTWFTPAARAAKQATGSIPIVMALAGNPVENGLVASLARPGGNVTGISGVGAERAGKCVELIREILPSAHRVAALANPSDPFSTPFVEHIRRAGTAAGLTIDAVMVHHPGELEAAFSAMEQDRPNAVIVQPSLPTRRVAELALRHRLAAVSITRAIVDAGGLMSYGLDNIAAYRQTAATVGKILKGAKPADLPVEEPTKFELVINLKTAKAIGLAIPIAFLERADDVIE